MKSQLIPYTAVDGIPTFADSFIMGLFKKMQEQDLTDDLFYDGSITTPEEFLNIMKFGKNSLFVVEHENDVAGVVWLNNFQKRSAECHFCFFSNVTGKELLAVGKQTIISLVNMRDVAGNPMFDVIVGITPINNRAALRFCRRLGFGVSGIVPKAAYIASQDASVSAQICYIERESYG